MPDLAQSAMGRDPQIEFSIESGELGRTQQGVDGCGALATRVGSSEKIAFSSESRPAISVLRGQPISLAPPS